MTGKNVLNKLILATVNLSAILALLALPAVAGDDSLQQPPDETSVESNQEKTDAGDDIPLADRKDASPVNGPDKDKDNGATAVAPGNRKTKAGALTSFAIGTLVGAPIAIVRRTVAETISGNQDIIRDSTNPILVVPATIISLPFSIPAGAAEGVFRSVRNSWQYKTTKPFSKDAFSLGSMD